MLLLNRKQINAKELAENFEVSQRTIYRDIEAINQAGIPIVSYMGAEGGFAIIENYKINKNFLDENEINAILTALKNINTTINNRRVANTMEKLLSMLPQQDHSGCYKNKYPINIDYSCWSSSNTDKDKLKILNKAIDEKRMIGFDYINTKGEYAHRLVEPLSLTLKDFAWYLHGFCHTKEDYRIFKVKRMHKVNMTGDSFSRDALPIEVLDYHEEWYKDKPELNIVLKFTSYAKTRVVDYFNEEQIQFNEDGTTTVKLTFPEDDWLFELILGFGSQVEVLEPPRLRSLIRQKAIEMADIYSIDKQNN
ncbi:MAG TPA: YafY family protein [Patescibacteria group bacterium]|nr:YafY family protein [Patescibacteria group bacterium]